MLNNLSIRKKLAVLLLVPLLTLTVVSGLSILRSLGESSDASDTERVVELTTSNRELFASLRTEAVLDLIEASGGDVESSNEEASTDGVRARWRQLAGGFAEFDTDGLISDIDNIEVHRSDVSTADPATAHSLNIELLGRVAAFGSRVAGEADGAVAVDVARSTALTNIELMAADAQLLGLWASGDGLIPSADLNVKLGASEAAIDSYNAGVGESRMIADPTNPYNRAVRTFGDELPGQITEVDIETWLSASQDRSDAIASAHQVVLGTAGAAAADEATSARGDLRTIGLLALVGVLGGLGLALLISRQMQNRVDSIRDEAATIAESDLPELATSLRTGQTFSPADRPLLDASGSDEFANLQQSLNRIRESATVVGKQQTEMLQSGISDMFVNLARRNQTLVDRQLQVIDELEAEERDPDRLSQMYRVDHLATRMRRNAESLLVLAGQTSPRRRGAPVDLREVVRVAIGEVEDYRRIIPIALDEIAVASHVAPDLAHLLSELMENATQSSPPGTVADVIGVSDADGSYTLQVIDRGTGIDEGQRDELNAVLATPPTNSLVMSRTMGLTVVGRLAKRLGINVTLNAGSESGTIATIDIPARTVAEWRGDDPEAPPQQAIQTVPGQFAQRTATIADPAEGVDDAVVVGFDAAPEVVTADVDGQAPEPAVETFEDVAVDTFSESDTPPLVDVPDAAHAPTGNADITSPVLDEDPFTQLGVPEPHEPELVDEFGLPVFDLPSLDPAALNAPADDTPTDDALEDNAPADDTLEGDAFEDDALEENAPAMTGLFEALDGVAGPIDDAIAPLPPIDAAPTMAPPPIPVMAEPVSAPETDVEPVVTIPEPMGEPAAPAFEYAPVETAPLEAAPLEPAAPAFEHPPVEVAPVFDPAPAAPAAPEATVTAPAPTAEAATTPSGLIRRQRKPPMSEVSAAFDRAPTATPSKRSPDQVKSMLSRYKSGLEKGRMDGES